ncbi:MAG: hypothetical protein KAR57_00605 [Bacteroidales bacterium]|nr:hypothetical protein [Bacteroidales bacterium]
MNELKLQLKSFLNNVKTDKKKIGFFFLMLSLISAIFRSQVSFLLYLSVITLILGLTVNLKEIIKIKNYLNRKLILWGLVIVFFMVPIIYEVVKFKNLFSELFNLIYIVGLFIGLYSYLIIDKRKYSKLFFDLFKFLFIVFGVCIVFYYSILLISSGSINMLAVKSLDNNFFSLNLLILLLFLFEKISKKENRGVLLFINFLLILISLLILFSGSRRGIFIFTLFISGFTIYSLINLKRLVKLIPFLSFVIISFTMIFYLAVGSNSTLRVYLVEKYSSNSQALKSQITQVEYKYFKALVSEVDYSSFYHRLWNTTNKKQYLINNLLSKKHKNNYKRVDRKENYNKAIEELYYYSLLKSDIEKTKVLANDISKNIPDTFFYASNIKAIPYYCNIPYRFKGSISLAGYKGLYPIDYSEKTIEGKNRLFIKFRTFSLETPKFFINFTGMPGNYSVEFILGLDTPVPEVIIKSERNNIPNCEIKNIKLSKLNDSYRKVKVDFLVKNISAINRLYLEWKDEESMCLSVSDLNFSFFGGSSEYYLNPTILPKHIRVIRKMNRGRNGQIKMIKLAITRHESMLRELTQNTYSQNLINDLEKLAKSKLYTNMCDRYIQDSVYSFRNFKNEDLFFFRKKIPAIPVSIVHINYKVKIINGLNHKLAKHPNRSFESLNFDLVKYQEKELDDDWIEYFLSYKINSSSSLIARYAAFADNFSSSKPIKVKDFNIRIECVDSINLENQSGFYIKSYLVNHEKDSIDLLRKDIMTKLKIETIKLDGNKFLNTRLNRWYLSLIYFKSYTAKEKIIGRGFEYSRIFPILLSQDLTKIKNDSPHNPIISSFLYSGIIGGCCYIVFLIYVILYFVRRIQKDPLLFIAFAIVLFFSFFSGISHFTIPIFIVFSIIPIVFSAEYRSIKTLK